MAFSTASISRPFHPNELLVAQSDRTLVRRNHTQANPPGTFRSVRDLIKAIQDYIRLYNKSPQPIQWVASASRIIKKVNKYKGISETGD
jgi:hypothetical protein